MIGTGSECTNPLLASFTFRLQFEDVLAYERLPRAIAGSEKMSLFAVPFVAGGVAGAVPETWTTPARWAAASLAALVLAGLLLAFRSVLRHRRARSLADGQGEMRVEDWGDHLAVYSKSGARFLALETIAQVIADQDHVFLRHQGGPTILPLRVFEDAADMQAYAEVLDKRCLEAGA